VDKSFDYVHGVIEIDTFWWLVWRSGNGIGHANKVKLRRARSVAFCGRTIATQPGHPSVWKRKGVLAMISATAGEETASSA